MATLSHNQDFEKILGFNDIIEDLTASKRSIKKYVGLVGLHITMPFKFISTTILVKGQSRTIDKTLTSLKKTFYSSDERGRMKLESQILKATKKLEHTLLPLLGPIAHSNVLFSSLFVKVSMKNFKKIKDFQEHLTSVVYPERINPASDSIRFQKLKDAYKNVDISDWKKEKSIYDSLHPKNACV